MRLSRYLLLIVLLTFFAVAAKIEPLVLLDEEDTINSWNGFTVCTETEFIWRGESSAGWPKVTQQSYITKKIDNPDWSDYDTFSFWCYSAVANGAEFMVYVSATNTTTADAYMWRRTVDWQGWTNFVIPFSKFNKAYNPGGWDKVNWIQFTTYGYSLKLKPDTELYLDCVELQRQSGGSRPKPRPTMRPVRPPVNFPGIADKQLLASSALSSIKLPERIFTPRLRAMIAADTNGWPFIAWPFKSTRVGDTNRCRRWLAIPEKSWVELIPNMARSPPTALPAACLAENVRSAESNTAMRAATQI